MPAEKTAAAGQEQRCRKLPTVLPCITCYVFLYEPVVLYGTAVWQYDRSLLSCKMLRYTPYRVLCMTLQFSRQLVALYGTAVYSLACRAAVHSVALQVQSRCSDPLYTSVHQFILIAI